MKSPSTAAYPFLTRKQIVAKIDSDAEFMGECTLVLEARTQMRVAGKSPPRKPWGWMSSERVVAGKLAAKVRAGSLTAADAGKLTALVRRYSRQIADHCCQLALAENPELSEIAARFGVLATGTVAQPDVFEQGATEQPVPVVRESDPSSESEHAQPGRTTRVLAFLEGHPGERAEAIARALDETTAMLAPTLREMVQGKRIRKQGVGRGTRYFVR